MEGKKVYKSRTDIKIDGVCAGIAKYFNMDPTIIRLIWAAAILFAGTGIFAYIICMILIPREPELMDHTGSGYDNQYHN